MSNNKINWDVPEHEKASLLASSSAPPDKSRPSLLNPYHPGKEPPQQHHPYSMSRQTLTNTTLAELERGAKRLADDNIDSDSVNGLLAGMEASDDEASMFGDKVGGLDAPVSMQDLEYLASRRASDLSELDIGESRKAKKMVDEIGNELLDVNNPELESRILRQSLKLGGISPKDLEVDDEEEEEERKQSFRDQSGHSVRVREVRESQDLSNRVHESTRALRMSVGGASKLRRVPSGAASMRRVPSGKAAAPAAGAHTLPRPPSAPEIEPGEEEVELKKRPTISVQVLSMVALMLFVMLLLVAALALGTLAVGPPRKPIGEYQILEAQVGNDFWQFYDFYAGKDSAGSNGYINYVSKEVATKDGIIEVVTEIVPKEKMIEIYEDGDLRAIEDWLAEDMAFLDQLKRQKEEEEESAKKEAEEEEESGSDDDEEDGAGGDNTESSKKKGSTKEKPDESKKKKKAESSTRRLQEVTDDSQPPKLEPFNPDNNSTVPSETFVMISSSPTPEGPRNSVRLEGRRRFNRGLFIIDLRHMPAGCGTWPAFWLTDEANWPVNGEIDIVEGVNYQNTAKTALHTTRECQMDDVPEGSKTGSWDTSVGIPNRKTGIPDMTFRWAQNCFVYDPHQWINQGCVATDLKLEGRSLGMPLNANGGGVYALEWDPVNRHIRTWVFSPHGRVPSNLRDALRTATNADVESRIAPDTNTWGLPYGHFPIGEGTNCQAGHFRNMRLVINLAFCGSVAGNRFFMDCPEKFKKYKTCNNWVASDPDELKQAYWKIRGVYVYERAWEKQWS